MFVNKFGLYRKELKQIMKTMSNDIGVKIRFDKMMAIGDGYIEYNKNYTPKQICIGIKDIYDKKSFYDLFLFSLVVIYHESYHFKQNKMIHNGTASIAIISNGIATFHNQKYYKKNYKFDIMELEADNYGIHMAYNRLLRDYPEINAIQHIKSYMKTRPFYEDYHDQIDQVKTIDDIDLILDQVFKNLPDQRKSLDTTDDFVVLINKYWTNTGINIMALLVQTENAIQELKEDDPEKWQDLSINFLCDKTVTAFTLMKVPEYQIFFDNIKEHIPTPDMIVQEFQDIIREKEEIKGLP